VAAPESLDLWCRTARRLLAPGGTLTLIWRAEGLGDVLAALARGFGGPAVVPIHPRPDRSAIRILVAAVKGAATPLRLLPGVFLNDSTGQPTPAAEAVLRGGQPLAME
jgi:tRNA1(Val) A37 N6-methylase TrmN6